MITGIILFGARFCYCLLGGCT